MKTKTIWHCIEGFYAALWLLMVITGWVPSDATVALNTFGAMFLACGLWAKHYS